MREEKLVVLIRHGETDWNAQFRWQGHIDIPLNEKGREQARGVVSSIWSLRPERVLSSDLVRARETAQIIADALSLPVEFSSALREVQVGEVEGWTQEEVIRKLGPEVLERWRSVHPRDLDFAFPGGETKHQLLERGRPTIENFLDHSEARSVAIVTHGMFMRTLIHSLFPELKEPVRIANCKHISLKYQPSGSVWIPGGELAGLTMREAADPAPVQSTSYW